MKKLTAGIFATIMGLTAVNAYAAGEKIATTNYVKGAMTAAETAAVAAVEAKGYATTTQAQGYANAALADAQTYAEGQASAAQAAAEKYTDDVVGTVPEGSDNVVAYVNQKTQGIATNGQITDLDTRLDTAESEIDELQAADATFLTKDAATATYETIANVDLVEGRVAALETADTTFLTKNDATATYATITTVNGIDTRVLAAEGKIETLENAGYAKTSEITGTATVTNAVLTGVKLENGVLSATTSIEIDDNYADDNQPAV